MTAVNQEERHIQWQQLEHKACEIRDALDTPIDPGIFEVVLALNALGLTTIASCEGHLDYGTGAPYIDLAAPGVEEAENQANLAIVAVGKEEESGQFSIDEIDEKYREAIALRRQAMRPHLELQAKLTTYLTRFYAERHVPFTQHLTIQGDVTLGSPMRLESQGAALQELAPTEEHAVNLQAYQEEMQALASFLKTCYFSE